MDTRLQIVVDRSVKPSYPNWVDKVMHPKLETSGPEKYYLPDVEFFFHPKQATEARLGEQVLRYLEDTEILVLCLNLQDGLAIQAKGVEFFREFFGYRLGGKAFFLWASVVRVHNSSGFRVPSLYDAGSKVEFGWRYINRYFSSNDPALRFK